jgi:GNAT superfamily N-acetyltransferase
MDANMIRTATFDDLDALVAMAEKFHVESYDWLPFEPEYVRENFRARCIDTVDGICTVIDDDGSCHGFLAATVTQLFAAPVKIGIELAMFIEPSYRGKWFVALKDEFEAWARWRGCIGTSLSMVQFKSETRNAAVDRLYRASGYEPYERGYLRLF